MEHEGRIERLDDRLFEGEEAVLHVIERTVAPLGLWVDATSPWVDARLPDGSRVQTRSAGFGWTGRRWGRSVAFRRKRHLSD